MNNKSILDNYTGAGTYDIQKNEVAQLFKPQDNTQNVYGNQNSNDFLQSRMNTSLDTKHKALGRSSCWSWIK